MEKYGWVGRGVELLRKQLMVTLHECFRRSVATRSFPWWGVCSWNRLNAEGAFLVEDFEALVAALAAMCLLMIIAI